MSVTISMIAFIFVILFGQITIIYDFLIQDQRYSIHLYSFQFVLSP